MPPTMTCITATPNLRCSDIKAIWLRSSISNRAPSRVMHTSGMAHIGPHRWESQSQSDCAVTKGSMLSLHAAAAVTEYVVALARWGLI